MEFPKIPRKTIYRISIYHRCLAQLLENGYKTISSSALAHAANVKPAQLRRDLSHLGQFGTRGLGYYVEELLGILRETLRTVNFQPVVLVGAGNLGSALLRYNGFKREGFKILAAFDAFPEKIIKKGHDTPILPSEEIKPFLHKHRIKMAILCVPPENAQEATNSLVEAGVLGILNFSSSLLHVPETVTVNNVDLAIELENLSFFVGRNK